MRARRKTVEATEGNKSNKLLRRIVLAVGLVCIALFLYFVYFFVVENRKLTVANDTLSEQIVSVSNMNAEYLATLRGNSDSAANLNQSIAKFDSALSEIKLGGDNISEPDAEQLAILPKIEQQWATLKPIYRGAISQQASTGNVREVLSNISVLVSEIKLSATRTKNSLDSFEGAFQVASNLEGMVSTSSRLDGAIQGGNATSVLSYANQIINLATAVNNDIRVRGNAAFRAQAGVSALNTLNGQVNNLRSSIATIADDVSAIEPPMADSSANLNRIELADSLRDLKDTYSISASFPISFMPLTTLQLAMLCLALGVVLVAVWAVLLLIDGRQINKEATRLRLAAEERNKNDQEAILRLMDELADLSEGDLTIEAQVTEDFTGAIADSINFTVENMRDMVGTITHTSEEITRATEVSKDVSYLLSESSGEQSRQINNSAETSRKMATSLHEISENTDSSVQIARSSVEMAQEGRNRVHSTIKSMNDIRENIQETAKRIKRLGESSQEIGDIVEIIKGIADQTNVLALNAAIQATAAGEAGRGFAVVADEVQRLAERSANATKRIEVLVKTIQADANEAVASMENSTKQVVTGTDVAEEAGHSLDQIESVSKNLANLIIHVSQATREAAGMAGNVDTNMGRLAELNEKAVNDVTTSVRSVDDLRELSASLKDSVAGFKLPA